jgi:hypothetical protein
LDILQLTSNNPGTLVANLTLEQLANPTPEWMDTVPSCNFSSVVKMILFAKNKLGSSQLVIILRLLGDICKETKMIKILRRLLTTDVKRTDITFRSVFDDFRQRYRGKYDNIDPWSFTDNDNTRSLCMNQPFPVGSIRFYLGI